MNKQKIQGLHSRLTGDNKVIGLKQVLKAAKVGQLSLIYIAADVDAAVSEQLLSVAKANRIPVKQAMTKHKLGQACQIDVGAACVGIMTKEA